MRTVGFNLTHHTSVQRTNTIWKGPKWPCCDKQFCNGRTMSIVSFTLGKAILTWDNRLGNRLVCSKNMYSLLPVPALV